MAAYPPFLHDVVREQMRSRGFRVEFPPAALAEAARAQEPSFNTLPYRDLTGLLWSSIDNDDSRDLDQVEYAVAEPDGIRLYVGVADVISFVSPTSALDAAARQNTTSVYTGVDVFPMLPERLSTELSSLLENQKRLAFITEMKVAPDGTLRDGTMYPAVIQNCAQLTYNAVAVWFEEATGQKELSDTLRDQLLGSDVSQRMLAKIRGNAELQKQLLLHLKAAQALRKRRQEAGALSLQVSELRPVVASDQSIVLSRNDPTRASRLIEDFMIAANQTCDRFLEAHGFPTFQRVVRRPKRWDRIVALAEQKGHTLPGEPDPVALQKFLADQRQKDPEHFPDLSLAVVKLLGRGEYVVLPPGQEGPGHFGLALQYYSHSTAPNRRYPDVLTQRLVQAACEGKPSPYSVSDLAALAAHCTEQEDNSNRVERFAKKCVAALALSKHVGETYDGIVTGASSKGTWVRLRHPPVEGRVERSSVTVDVGDSVSVRLLSTDARRGYIDFEVVRRLA